MSVQDLLAAGEVYGAATHAEILRHAIQHAGISRVCLSLSKLQQSLGDLGEDDFWSRVLALLRRLRFHLCAVPLPLNHPSVLPSSTLAALGRQATQCRLMFPDYAPRLEELVTILESLSQTGEQPLLDAARRHVEIGMVEALLLKPTRFLPDVEAHLHSLPSFSKVETISVSQLRAARCYDRLLVIGPAYWFPEYVFTAPRARDVHLLVYSCIRDTYASEPVFLQPSGTRTGRLLPIRQGDMIIMDAGDQIPAADLLPSVPWSRFAPQESAGIATSRTSDEAVARLFLLEGDLGVYLEAETSVVVIDLTEEEDERVRRLNLSDVSLGMFVLLRTERGGDYVAAVADRLLGSQAALARDVQRQWKERLRREVQATSLLEVSLRLLDLGSLRADEGNVRNWMSPRNIRTHDRRDFLAIMRLTGFEDRAEQIWNTMGEIDSAHRRAGALIRRRLLEQVANADLNALERLGRMDFELPEADGGQLTAFRVVAVSPDTSTVPAGRVGDLLEMESLYWPG